MRFRSQGQTSTRAIAQRIQPVMGILTLIQRFNQVVTIVDEFREFEAGNPVQTQTIYFGWPGPILSMQPGAMPATAPSRGLTGGSGRSSRKWHRVFSRSSPFHRGTEQARYINLPVEIR